MTQTGMELTTQQMAQQAKKASKKLLPLSANTKESVLNNIADAINNQRDLIFEANQKDLSYAKELVQQGKLTESLVHRLKLDHDKINDVICGLKDVAKQPDPVNQLIGGTELDQDLYLYKVTCPIGVICVIFESRPDVIPQIVSLAIKSSNAVILKGGIEAAHTNARLMEIILEVIQQYPDIPHGTINLVTTREEIQELLHFDDYIDLIIPRGSNSFVKYIQENTKIPVLGHSQGLCHLYIDQEADLSMAASIVVDAKTQYPSACNAIETLLVHQDIAAEFLPLIASKLTSLNVELRGCTKTLAMVNTIKPALENDWQEEYTDLILSIKVVNSIEEAIDHINTYGSGHTDGIVTQNYAHVNKFVQEVDSAGVYHNASTRFADGYRYGLGAEVGISTNKIHARGPVGIEGLLSYKYRVFGNGHIVEGYGKTKHYTHKPISL